MATCRGLEFNNFTVLARHLTHTNTTAIDVILLVIFKQTFCVHKAKFHYAIQLANLVLAS